MVARAICEVTHRMNRCLAAKWSAHTELNGSQLWAEEVGCEAGSDARWQTAVDTAHGDGAQAAVFLTVSTQGGAVERTAAAEGYFAGQYQVGERCKRGQQALTGLASVCGNELHQMYGPYSV